MRQFILGKSVTYTTQTTLDKVEDGAVAFFHNKAGNLAVNKDGKGLEKELMLVLGRPAANGGPVVLPVFKNNFSFTKSVYAAAVQFDSNITIPSPNQKGSYGITVVKKGVKFNERNKWTADVYVANSAGTNADALATALEKELKNKNIDIIVTRSGAKITIKGAVKGEDWEIIPCDLLTGTKVTYTHRGTPAINDAKMIADMYCKAAADRGIEYTYKDAEAYMYPEYPLNPLAQPDAVDAGYTVYTLRFSEPRDVKTRDEVVNQIIQVAFPMGAGQMTEFEAVCKVLAGAAPAEIV